uniref:Transposase n=1 Tax=Globodera rostochiensis TaxID=31243 RepID=A0A914HRG9_GLORO
MEKLWILILVAFFATNSLDKAESVQLFDEIFGEGWWDNDKAKEWDKLTLEQNALHQIDRQNTQIGQIEPNSTDQNPPLTESDHSRQIEPNSTDQNPPLTESDHHSVQIEANSTDQNPAHTESDQTDNAKNGKEQSEIMKKITSNKKLAEEEGKHKTVAKELGLSFVTIYNWKRELGQSKPNHIYGHTEQKELMKRYYEIKYQMPKISDDEIAKKMLKIGSATLKGWKRQFKR